jgi:hypothetical protein
MTNEQKAEKRHQVDYLRRFAAALSDLVVWEQTRIGLARGRALGAGVPTYKFQGVDEVDAKLRSWDEFAGSCSLKRAGSNVRSEIQKGNQLSCTEVSKKRTCYAKRKNSSNR